MDSSYVVTDFEMINSIMLETPEEIISDLSDEEVKRIDKQDSVCTQVSVRRAEYDAQIATEKGLVSLGKQLALQENKKEKRRLKYQYLVTSVKELDNFDGGQFVSDFKKCTDKDLSVVKVRSLVGYVSMFKELYQHHLEDIAALNKEIIGLKNENTDMGEMVDKYIEELDQAEEKVKEIAESVGLYKEKFNVHEKALKEAYEREEKYHKRIVQLTTDNQIYTANEKVLEKKLAEKNKLIKKTTADLKKRLKREKISCNKYFFISITSGIVIIGSFMYTAITGCSPMQKILS